MVSTLDSGSIGLSSSLGRGTALCSWKRHIAFSVPFHPDVQYVLEKLTIPSRGE